MLASRLPGQKAKGYKRQLRTGIKSRTLVLSRLPGSMARKHCNKRELRTPLNPRILVSRASGLRLPGQKVRGSEGQLRTLVNPRCYSSGLLASRGTVKKLTVPQGWWIQDLLARMPRDFLNLLLSKIGKQGPRGSNMPDILKRSQASGKKRGRRPSLKFHS